MIVMTALVYTPEMVMNSPIFYGSVPFIVIICTFLQNQLTTYTYYTYIINIPLIFKIKNLKFYIYLKDHLPAHIHVNSPDSEAKIDIHTFEVLSSKGFHKKDLNRIVKLLKERQKFLVEIWRDNCEE